MVTTGMSYSEASSPILTISWQGAPGLSSTTGSIGLAIRLQDAAQEFLLRQAQPHGPFLAVGEYLAAHFPARMTLDIGEIGSPYRVGRRSSIRWRQDWSRGRLPCRCAAFRPIVRASANSPAATGRAGCVPRRRPSLPPFFFCRSRLSRSPLLFTPRMKAAEPVVTHICPVPLCSIAKPKTPVTSVFSCVTPGEDPGPLTVLLLDLGAEPG